MSDKMSKTIQNIDNYFNEAHLFRKAIVHDDSCLFRAVSERLFFTQCHNERVKDTCMEYMERHAEDYQPFMLENMSDIIKQLKAHTRSAGHLEMIIMSRIYRMDFFLYHPSTFEQCNVTQNNYRKKIYLCYTGDGHYDLVYSKDCQQSMAVCQSLLYELLYQRVFGMEAESEEAVVFLHIKKFRECSVSDVVASLGEEKLPVIERLSGRTFPPLPYRVAKALHPCIYRNVEFDIIHEELREAKLFRQPYFAKFSIGDKCQVNLEDDANPPYNGHIQELDTDLGLCVVYIEELTIKKRLPARCITPLPIRSENQGNLSEWQVADIDLVRFQKRGRRRKILTAPASGDQLVPSRDQAITPQLTPHHQPPTYAAAQHSLLHQDAAPLSRLHDNCRRYQPPAFPNTQPGPAAYTNHTPPPQDNSKYTAITYYQHNTDTLHQQHLDNNYSYHHLSDNGHCCITNNTGHDPIFLEPGGYPFPASHPTDQTHTVPAGTADEFGGSWNFDVTGTPTPVVPSCHQVFVGDTCTGVLVGVSPSYPPYPATDNMANQAQPSQGPMFVMPMMTLPYGASVGQVNVAWGPSQEPTDENNTPFRYVSNTGVEYYRMSSHPNMPVASGGYNTMPGTMYLPPHNAIATTDNGNYCSIPVPVFSSNPGVQGHHQQQQQQYTSPTVGGYFPVAAGSQQGPSGENRSSSDNIVTSSTPNASLVNKAKPGEDTKGDNKHSNKDSNQSSNSEDTSKNSNKSSSSVMDRGVGVVVREELKEEKVKCNNGGGEGGGVKQESKGGKNGVEYDVGSDGGDHMDVGSDGDSGCPSECTDLSPASAPDTEFVDSTTADNASSSLELTKPRGKRRYYMYGNHKLIKPIKEIPQRFQTLLSETRAAKARCEGQPIYMQPNASPSIAPPQPYEIVYYQTPEESQQGMVHQLQQQPLNANANCFVPGQGCEPGGVTFVADDMTVCPVPDYNNGTPNPSQMCVPPPGHQMATPSSQSCPTIIVYSNNSPSSSSSSSSSSYLPQTSMVYARPSQHVQSIPMPPPPFPPPPSMPPPPHIDVSHPSTPMYPPPLSNNPMPPPIATNTNLDSRPKPAKPISLNLTSPPNVTLTHQCPPSGSNLNTNTYLPYAAYCKPHNVVQSPMSVDGTTPQTFVAPPPVSVPCVTASGGTRGAPTSQYMYVYPSNPTGAATNPAPQGPVMYMVSPASYTSPSFPSQTFQQQPGLVVPSVAAQ